MLKRWVETKDFWQGLDKVLWLLVRKLRLFKVSFDVIYGGTCEEEDGSVVKKVSKDEEAFDQVLSDLR